MVAGREVSPKDIQNTERLKRYWAYGQGSLQWKSSPTPYRTLRTLLSRFVTGEELDGLAANIFHMALGFWPGTPHVGIVPTPGRGKNSKG